MQEILTPNKARSASVRVKQERPDAEQQLEGLRDLEGLIIDISRAAYVMDELLEFELQSGEVQDGSIFPYKFNQDQVDGLVYLSGHIRDLSRDLEKRFQTATDGPRQ